MTNSEVVSAAGIDNMAGERVFCLTKNVAAIQVLAADGKSEARLGMITQLPQGAELRTCGAGFNERTVKVRWAEGQYFVFLQDLEVPRAFPASA